MALVVALLLMAVSLPQLFLISKSLSLNHHHMPLELDHTQHHHQLMLQCHHRMQQCHQPMAAVQSPMEELTLLIDSLSLSLSLHLDQSACIFWYACVITSNTTSRSNQFSSKHPKRMFQINFQTHNLNGGFGNGYKL